MAQKFIARLIRIDELIIKKATGTPLQFARRLQITESTLYEDLKSMKKLGCPIYYDLYRQSYCYYENGHFFIGFQKN
jgi:predicted DNA-binding transcriptional regulator YafY